VFGNWRNLPAFSGDNKYTGDGYTRPNAYSIVSYDGLLTLLTGCQTALQGGKSTITPDDLQKALTQITGSKSLQGVSGQISFDSKNDPINKPVFIVEINQDGTSRIVPDGIQGGCYVKGCV
jgi:ABC-type branched-subunit amino acid transport system substrate-binding protein